jgi:nucleotide-binding universal stress UspA family protein
VPELLGLGLPPDLLDAEHTERTAAAALDAAVRVCRRAAPDLEVHGELLLGDPVELLVKLADGAALLVLGASGQTGHPLVLLGSTAAELARRVATPVAVIRWEPGGPPAVAPVVVGVDGSPAPAAAVHAWLDLPVAALAAEARINPDQARAAAEALLDEQLAEARQQYPDVAVRTVAAVDRPTVVLLDHARGAGLLVVGRHGWAHSGALPLGSVSHAVLRAVPGAAHRLTVPAPSPHAGRSELLASGPRRFRRSTGAGLPAAGRTGRRCPPSPPTITARHHRRPSPPAITSDGGPACLRPGRAPPRQPDRSPAARRPPGV